MVYPPVTGMLLTRYAPLRRSPAMYCYIPLPLDLHVLSLPLAFILSQDQTLHCIYSIKLLAPVTRSYLCFQRNLRSAKIQSPEFCCLSFQYFQWTFFSQTSVRWTRSSVLGPQRYALFLYLQIFLKKFLKIFSPFFCPIFQPRWGPMF